MPRSSKRIKLIRQIRKLCNRRLLALQQRYVYLEDDEIEDEIDAWAFRKLCEAESQRYSTQRKYRKYSMNHFREDLEESEERGEVPFLTDDEFLQKYRMSRDSFNELVGLIKDHVVFKRGRRGPKQAPPEYQLKTPCHVRTYYRDLETLSMAQEHQDAHNRRQEKLTEHPANHGCHGDFAQLSHRAWRYDSRQLD